MQYSCRRLLLLPLLLTCLSAAPPDKEPSAARRMLELSGTETLGRQLVDQVVRQIRRDMPTVPAAFWDDFARGVDPRGLIDEMTPVYEKHFTPEELAELVRFYESPVGHKLVAIQPQLNRDNLGAGQRWGTRVSKDLIQQLKASGHLRK